MPVPYNTGRVKIGIAYETPNNYEMSRDAERIQLAMIQRIPTKRNRLPGIIATVSLLIVSVAIITLL